MYTIMRFLLPNLLICLFGYAQPSILPDSTQSPAPNYPFESSAYIDLLKTTIQTNSDGESALKSTIIEVRMFALAFVLGIVTLSRRIQRGWKLKVGLAVTGLVVFIWGYDAFNTSMIITYQDRSTRVVEQIDSMRTYGAAISASMKLPPMESHSPQLKLFRGITCVGLLWYGGVLLFAWLIILVKEDALIQ